MNKNEKPDEFTLLSKVRQKASIFRVNKTSIAENTRIEKPVLSAIDRRMSR